MTAARSIVAGSSPFFALSALWVYAKSGFRQINLYPNGLDARPRRPELIRVPGGRRRERRQAASSTNVAAAVLLIGMW